MKRLIFVLLAVLGISLTTSAMAETYTVQSGDTLPKVAKQFGVNWRSLRDANKIKHPQGWIFLGQVLVIPEKENKASGKKAVSVSPAKRQRGAEFIYDKPDHNPVGKETSPIMYIINMELPDPVTIEFVTWARSGKDSMTALISKANNPKAPKDAKIFSKLDFMGFGKQGGLEKNVKVVFDTLRPAKYWQMDYEGVRYFLVCDQGCFNWASVQEKIEVPVNPAPEVPPPAPPVSVEPPTVIPPADEPPVEKVEAPPVVEETSCKDCALDVEAWLYGGINRGVQQGSKDRGVYRGESISVFSCKWAFLDGYVRVGPAWQYVDWMGRSGNVDYDGHFNLFGGEAQYLTDSTKDQIKLLFGNKDGYVDGRGFPYRAHEWAKLFAIEGAHQWWNAEDRWQWEVGFRFEIATGNGKHSTMNGITIPSSQDKANDQSVYTVRAKRTWMLDKNFMPTLEGSIGYRAFDEKAMAQIRPGIKFWAEKVEVSAHYQRVQDHGTANDQVGLNLNINLSKVVKDWITGGSDG